MIFSQSISDGCYPEQFKLGQITPIFKCGKKSEATNYRGVSVLPNLAKVFERVVYCQLKMIIAPRISKTQHGFLSNRNIESNLMELTTLAHEAFERGAQLNVFYADIAKAFDSVDTSLLIQKLAKYPVSNEILKWFISYLQNRSQYIRVKSAKSNTFCVPSGVGQGTILGPLLFLIFFNDSDANDDDLSNIFYLNFADDKKIAAIIKTEEDAIKLQKAIDNFMQWCKNNGLFVNASKWKMMIFKRGAKPEYTYTMNNQTIENVSEIKDLGVFMDTKLTFATHIEYMTNKAKIAWQFVRRQSHHFDQDTVQILYSSLVRSIIEFASTIWSPSTFEHRKQIESIQKQMMIFYNGDHLHRDQNNYVLRPYNERCDEAGMQTLIRRRVNASALFIHGLISGKVIAPNLRNKMTLNPGTRCLRNPEFIRIKVYKHEYSYLQPFNVACHIFNLASLHISAELTICGALRQK